MSGCILTRGHNGHGALCHGFCKILEPRQTLSGAILYFFNAYNITELYSKMEYTLNAFTSKLRSRDTKQRKVAFARWCALATMRQWH